MEDLVPVRCNSIRGDDLFRAGDRFALLHARLPSSKLRLLLERAGACRPHSRLVPRNS
jgi:hypothetical protein